MDSVQLRSRNMEDAAFLYQLYKSVRWNEVSSWGWSEDQIEVFLNTQYQFQQHSYQRRYADGECFIICQGEVSIGKFHISRQVPPWVIIDIALMPEYQNQGIGSRIIRGLLTEAASMNAAVRLSVMKGNPAERLYEKLGFTTIQEDEMYKVLEVATLD